MRFLLLLRDDAEAAAALSPDERRAIVGEHLAFRAALKERGALVAAEALTAVDRWATVRPGTTPLVTDGPFAETREQLGALYLIDCADRDEALALAARAPRSPGLTVEVLPTVPT